MSDARAPFIRHLLRKCHLPPSGGKVMRADDIRPYDISYLIPVSSVDKVGGSGIYYKVTDF